MNVTKLHHSCLLVKEGGSTVLFDPGIFSYESGDIDFEQMHHITHVFITHAHPDHCHPAFVQEIRRRNPKCIVMGNTDVAAVLRDHGISVATTPPHDIEFISATHEQLWSTAAKPPQNTAISWKNITHMGDSLQAVISRSVLAIPITAPWGGGLTGALNLAMQVRPKVVLPIHDWHLSDAGRTWYYQRAKVALEAEDIQFVELQTGIEVEVTL